MNKVKIITLVCWIITALVLIGLAAWFITGFLIKPEGSSRFPLPGIHFGWRVSPGSLAPYGEAGTYNVSPDGIDSIDIRWAAGDVIVTPYDGSDITFTEYIRGAVDTDEKLVYDTAGGALEIRYTPKTTTFNVAVKKLELFVPRELAGRLNRLSVESASADLTVSGLTADSLRISQASGAVGISDVAAGAVDIGSASGAVDLSGIRATVLEVSTVSGAVTVSEATAATVNAATTSGALRLSGDYVDMTATSVSGAITIECADAPDRISCATTSGGITAALPEASGTAVSYSTISGRFHSDIPVITGKGAPYSFSSVSGSITLQAA